MGAAPNPYSYANRYSHADSATYTRAADADFYAHGYTNPNCNSHGDRYAHAAYVLSPAHPGAVLG